jgi:hypothetical protein
LTHFFKDIYFLFLEQFIYILIMGIGDWERGLGIGDWAQSPIPNPQSPIPNPQSPAMILINLNKNILNIFQY